MAKLKNAKTKLKQNKYTEDYVYLIPIPKTLIFVIFRHLKRGGILAIFGNFENFKNAKSSFQNPLRCTNPFVKFPLTHWLQFYGFAGKRPKWCVEWCVLNYRQCVEIDIFRLFTIRFGVFGVFFGKKVVCFHFCPVFCKKNGHFSSFFGPQNLTQIQTGIKLAKKRVF